MHLPARTERVRQVGSPGVAALWLAIVLLLTACQAQVSRLAPEANIADRQNCHGVHLVNVVAHMDDDLLFIDPRISQVLAAGGCVTSIFMNGGSSGAGFEYVLKRENASTKAYEKMLGFATGWTPYLIFTDSAIVMSVKASARPGLKLIFLRVPGGNVRGGDVPLADMLDLDKTVRSWPYLDSASGPVNLYSRTSFVQLLTELIVNEGATRVYALNPDTVPYTEHPDHIYSARLTRLALRGISADIPVIYHETYPSAAVAPNVDPAAVQAKRHVVASYFHFEGAEPVSSAYSEATWNGNWVARLNSTLSHAHAAGPVVNIPFRPLVNFQTQQCLVANGLGQQVTLEGCEPDADQRWAFVPSDIAVGASRGVALLKTASGHCIARQNGQLIEHACESNDPSQHWTPWDFGKIYVPGAQGQCLDGVQPSLIADCMDYAGSMLWVRSIDNIDSNDSMEVALTGDLIGDGTNRTLQVQRRQDGPGVDIWVTSLDADAIASEKWYEDRLPFDPDSFDSGCATAICYDSTRYLLADFTGDGKADLMAISPGKADETIFRLLKNEGDHFADPIIWRSVQQGHAYRQAQQYLAGDFRGVGKQDVLIVQTLNNKVSDFWLMENKGASLGIPAHWGDARKNALPAHFYSARLDNDDKDDVLAVDSSEQFLKLLTYRSSGRSLDFEKALELPGFYSAGSKTAVLDSPITKLTDVWVLHARSDGSDINFWKVKNLGGGEFEEPSSPAFETSVLNWADVRPYGLRTGRQILLPYRVNDPVQEYYWRIGKVGFKALNLSEQGMPVGIKDYGRSPRFEWANLQWRARLN
ncbi:PIG-L family deacetylase [Pseudomonas sp. GM30]|uniref:PIG-L family deacetylase n=1 Tax=Pseudomonas sp. GM30 TaxID=1144328 RepID=UPI00026FF247|nr:PIG-L family deacetylase [Pseudomonas sp. GM30]EUB85745.1 LmbE family protein [Pseudomonas sp. GM30]